MIILRRGLFIVGLAILLLGTYAVGYISHTYLPNSATIQIDRWLGLDIQTPAHMRPADLSLYWEVWQLLERDFYGEPPDLTRRTYGSIRGLVESYGDAYTNFVEPAPHELQQDTLQGRYGGIGAWIDRDETGLFLRPMPGQPAQNAGILEGDQLLAIDGTEITPELSMEAIIALVRGPIDSQVCFSLRRSSVQAAEAQSLQICVTRAEIQIPSLEWRLLDEEAETATIGYLRQTTFSDRSFQEMETAVAELQEAGAQAFILDLRGNPGGLLRAAVDVADLWLDGGMILYEERANGETQEFLAHSGGATTQAPLVIVVDGGSASASEIVAGALQDNGRAVLVGETTYGKGSVQLIHELVDKSSLHVTTAHWFTPNHRAINGSGLTPDIVVEPGTDPLPRAIALVQELNIATGGQ